MDKQKYETPEMEIIIFDAEDVITTSLPGEGGEGSGGGTLD